MDNKHTSMKIQASVGLIIAALLAGQSAYSAEAPKHTVAKSKKATKRTQAQAKPAQATPAAIPTETTPAAKPVVAVPAKAVESGVLSADARELTEPKSYVEAGVLGVTDTNWKFGQYNGLPSSGAYGIGNLDIRGGGSYDSGDATRWRFTGKNIGLETREFTGEYGSQGKYKLNIGYNEIFRYGQGTFQTPYLGAGGNVLSLPGNWQNPTVPNAFNSISPAANNPANNPAPNMRGLTPTDLADFHNVDLSTKRRRVDGGFSYFLSPEWELKASARHEDKNGIKSLGAPINAAYNTGNRLSPVSASAFRAVILPDPVSQSTDQVNASINFTGDKAYGSFAYYGSIFHNDYNSVYFQNAYVGGAGAPASNPSFGGMSTMPDNQFHQFTLSGGYNFSADTKLIASGGYGRNWQDQGFLPNSTLNGAIPVQGNLNGAVDFKNANVKLTHRANQDLNFAAAYKYDERENRTSINTYEFPVADASGTGVLSGRNNTPFSKRVQTGNLDANYSFLKGHWLKLGYEIQNIDRWCNSSWISCVETPTTTENTGKIDYRGTFFNKVNAKLGYSYSHRKADHYNQDSAFLASYEQPQTAADWALFNRYLMSGLPAWGPYLGYAPRAGIPYPYPTVYANNNPAFNNGNNPAVGIPDGNGGIDVAGLGRFNTASRNRQSLHSMVDYQVTDKLNLGINGDWRYDDYNQSSYGLQSSKSWSINFDGNYIFNEDFSAHVFYTFQNNMNQTSGLMWTNNSNTGSARAGSVIGGCYNNVLAMNNNGKIDPCRNWQSNMTDNIDTVGFGLKHKGFLNGKLDLNGDFLYSFAKTLIDVDGGQYAQVAGANTTNGPYYYINAIGLPEVKSQLLQFKLDAKYSFNKSSAAHLTYMFQHLISNDYIYTGMQPYGSPTGLMPTMEKAPVYTVHAVGLSYIYNF